MMRLDKRGRRYGLRERLLLANLLTACVVVAIALLFDVAPSGRIWWTFVILLVAISAVTYMEGTQWLDRLQRLRWTVQRLQRKTGADEEGDELDDLGERLTEVAERYQTAVTELRTEQDLSKRILEGMQEGVLLLDRQQRILMANAALKEMLILGPDVHGKPLVDVVSQAELSDLVTTAAQEGAGSTELELEGLRPRRVIVRALPLSGGGGGILAVFVDVTDIRRLENLRREFVANVSHELRTPVTSVLSAAETLREAIVDNPTAAAKFVGIIERNTERLRRLIEDILDLSRIEARELKLAREPIALRAFFEHICALFRDRADKRGMVLRSEGDASLTLLADRRALEQILANLVDNAVKYAREKGTISLSAEVLADTTIIIVADDGPGIDRVHLTRLFERFYRVDPGRSREQGGTGLGLSIVKHLAEAMGGSVTVQSDVGKGTSFRVELPNREQPNSVRPPISFDSTPPPPVRVGS